MTSPPAGGVDAATVWVVFAVISSGSDIAPAVELIQQTPQRRRRAIHGVAPFANKVRRHLRPRLGQVLRRTVELGERSLGAVSRALKKFLRVRLGHRGQFYTNSSGPAC